MSRLDYIVKEKIEIFEKAFKGTPQEKIMLLKQELESCYLEIAQLKIALAGCEGGKAFEDLSNKEIKEIVNSNHWANDL